MPGTSDHRCIVTRQKLSNVQALRFIAAAGVVVDHTARLFVPSRLWLWSIPWNIGVDVFFVISGFVMTYLAYDKFGQAKYFANFLIRRAIRIVPAYWFYTTITIVVVLYLGNHVRDTKVDAAGIETSYLFIPWPREKGDIYPLLSQGWTLNYEVFFYLFFAAFLPFRRGLGWLIAAFLIIVCLHPWIPETLFMLRFWSEPIILEFLGGIGLSLLFMKGARLSLGGSLACLVLAVALFIGARGFDGMHSRVIVNGLPALLVCAALALGAEPQRLGRWRRALVRGGDSSYTLYLSHGFTINAAAILWRQLGGGLPWIGFSAALAFALVTAEILYRWIERPGTDALQRRARFKPARGFADVAP